MKDRENVKNIIIGAAALIIFALILILLAGIQKKGEENEDWRVEGQVIKREVVTRDDEKNGTEKVYLIDCKDDDGVVHTFELTDSALKGNIGAAEAFREIETGKAYRFKVGWQEKRVKEKPGYYPSIYGAASLVEFNLEVAGKDTQESTKETADKNMSADVEEPAGTKEAADPKASAQITAALEGWDTTKPADDEQPEGDTETTSAPETKGRKETDRMQDEEEKESPAKLEIGGIKIEPVEETIDEEMLESLEDQVKSDLEDSIRAELEESFDAERKSLQKEIENLQEKLR